MCLLMTKGPLIGVQFGTVLTFKGSSEPDSWVHTHTITLSHTWKLKFWGPCRKGTLSDFPGLWVTTNKNKGEKSICKLVSSSW